MPASGSERPQLLPPPPPASQEQSAEPRPHGELQYLGQIEHILRSGFRKDDRTGTGTLSVFGLQARYNLRGDCGLAGNGLVGGRPGGLGAAAGKPRGCRGRGARARFSPNLPSQTPGLRPELES